MVENIGFPLAAALVGAFGGILLGLAARFGRFCTLGAIEDWQYGSDATRLWMWGLAIGVAVSGTYGLIAVGALDPKQTLYLGTAWSPLASVLGGLTFGYGMAIAGNCGYGALARLGGGDFRSFVIVLVMGLSAMIALSGPLAPLRIAIFPNGPPLPAPEGIAFSLSDVIGPSPAVIGLIIGIVLIAICLSSSTLRQKPKMILWGTVVGLAIVSAWAGMQYLATESFGDIRVRSHTFTAPVGETMFYLMTSTGSRISFGVGSVFGVLVGALIGSLIKGHFRWEACDDPRELRRQIIGAALMGIGAVVALGCSVGQGLSAMSLLSWSGPVTLLSIYAGASLGLKQLITGFHLAE